MKVSLRYHLLNVGPCLLVNFISPLGITYFYCKKKKIFYSLESWELSELSWYIIGRLDAAMIQEKKIKWRYHFLEERNQSKYNINVEQPRSIRHPPNIGGRFGLMGIFMNLAFLALFFL